uniref:CHK domain-containing protein n=1 Tax=Panagrellus redivivus TaxID=6233 RepID=A0A7E4VJK2_PANRE
LQTAKNAILRLEIRHTFISCVTHGDNVVFFLVLMDTLIPIHGDGFDAVDVFFKSHFALDYDPATEYKFVYDYLNSVVFDTSKTPAGFDNFLDDLKRMSDVAAV